MKNKKLLSLLETAAKQQVSDKPDEVENLGAELTTKLKGGAARSADDDEFSTMNAVCGPIRNASCANPA